MFDFQNMPLSTADIQNCYLCNQSSSALICSVCSNDLPRLFEASQHENLLSRPKIRQAIGKCCFDSLYVPYRYQWPLSALIKDVKFARKDYLATYLATLMLSYLEKAYHNKTQPQALIPVPLHSFRYLGRKYNQATLIAKVINKQLSIPLRTDICQRVQHTQAQTMLTGHKRRLNLKHAFTARPVPELNHIAILDDVITTGATINNLTSVLKANNPNLQVDVWTLAISI